MYLTRNEKLAIAHALNEVIIADGEATHNERNFISEVLINFGFKPADLAEARNLDISSVLSTIKNMNNEKKEFFKGAMANMALIDGEDSLNSITQRVVSMYFSIL